VDALSGVLLCIMYYVSSFINFNKIDLSSTCQISFYMYIVISLICINPTGTGN